MIAVRSTLPAFIRKRRLLLRRDDVTADDLIEAMSEHSRISGGTSKLKVNNDASVNETALGRTGGRAQFRDKCGENGYKV